MSFNSTVVAISKEVKIGKHIAYEQIESDIRFRLMVSNKCALFVLSDR